MEGLLNLVTVAGHPHLPQASRIPLWSSYHCGPRETSHTNREPHVHACAACHLATPRVRAHHFPGTKSLIAYFTHSTHSTPKGERLSTWLKALH